MARGIHLLTQSATISGSTSDHESKAEFLYEQLPDGPFKLDLDTLTLLVNEIGKNVHEMKQCLHQMELNIVTNFSSWLLSEVLIIGMVPMFPYLIAAAYGKLKRLKELNEENN
ncbi:hypothetical protein GOP47_0028942 [Adiantum capillus-veneris]|nr:hypothetical protein GOP47_0028942 [Adiantum capillus-veneris]